MDIRKDVQGVIDGILTGKILDTFDKYYADKVVMSENGADERVGKATNRQYEEAFLANTEFHSAKVGAIVVDGNNAAVEWTFEVTPKGGSRVVMRQVALQTWNDGKIVREAFYHA